MTVPSIATRRGPFPPAMSGWLHNPFARKHGFTLIELLLVLVILGIMAAVVVPQVGASMAGTKLASAARSVIQASRYARTMALLHQAETELVLETESGKIRVRAKAGSGYIAQQLDDISQGREAIGESGSEETPEARETAEAVLMTNRSSAVSTAKTFADEIETDFVNEGITYRFLGHTDCIDDATLAAPPDGAGEGEEILITFRSNGTCRPFRLRVMDKEIPDDEYMDLSVDIMGTGRIEGQGEEE